MFGTISGIITTLSTIASAVDTHLNQRRKAKQAVDYQQQTATLLKRIDQLEQSDIEQAELTARLSRNLEELAHAIQAEIDRNTRRDLRHAGVVYASLFISCAALVLAIWALAK